MSLSIYNNDLELESLIDDYKSLIWTERYNSYGDFELVLDPQKENVIGLVNCMGYFLVNSESEYAMIIETYEIQTDFENGDSLILKGRSLESILSRRIIWQLTVLNGNFQNGIQKILNENAIDPIPVDLKQVRKITRLIFNKSNDSYIDSLKIDAQFTGDNLYESIKAICDTFDIGFKISLNLQKKNFIFSLYAGLDRSDEQDIEPYVIFSNDFDNLASSNYYESTESYANVTLIGGEGEGKQRKYATFAKETNSDLARYEIFTDARDISSDKEDGSGTLSNAEYQNLLIQRGKNKILENDIIKSFEGEYDFNSQYKYKRDFFLGDIVNVENEYGISAKVRISEIVSSIDEDGTHTNATFTYVSTRTTVD